MESSTTIGPRSFGKQLDLAFNIYFKRFATLFGAAAAIALPLAALTIVTDLIAFQEAERLGDAALYEFGDERRLIDEDRYLGILAGQQVLALFGYLLIIGAAYRAASRAYLGEPTGVGSSLAFAGRRLHSILWVSILVTLATLLGLLALIVGAIFIGIALVLAVPVLMVEDLKGFAALRRSFRLVQDNWWRTFGLVLVTGLFAGLVGVVAGIVQAVADPLAESNFTLWVILVDLLGGIVNAIAAPLTAVVAIVIYYDLRMRKEGFDIELLADRAARDADQPAPDPGLSPPPPPRPPLEG